MKNYFYCLLVIVPIFFLTACSEQSSHPNPADTAEGTTLLERPGGGRLLQDGDFSLELAIYESGTPPEFRAWPSQGGRAVNPQDVQLSVELSRLGGQVDRIEFAPSAGYLRGNQTVMEPHSFDVKVTARHAGKAHQWSYASYEGRVTIPAAMAQAAGIKTAIAGPGVIEQTLRLYGSIVPDAQRVREIKARFPGVIRTLNRQVGDRVRAGDVLATVESNESLQVYPIAAPIGGIVTQRNAQVGEQSGNDTLFEIADFGSVWAEFSVFPKDRGLLKLGQRVRVRAEGGIESEGKLIYVAPLSSQNSQAVKVRVSLENGDARWTPGQFVEGFVVAAQSKHDVVVPLSALQTFRESTVVFAQVGEVYEARVLILGRRDAKQVEVLTGLSPGTAYVTDNSYLIKADIEKSGADHDH